MLFCSFLISSSLRLLPYSFSVIGRSRSFSRSLDVHTFWSSTFLCVAIIVISHVTINELSTCVARSCPVYTVVTVKCNHAIN